MTKREDAQEAKLLAAEEAAWEERGIAEVAVFVTHATYSRALSARIDWQSDGPAPRDHKPGALGNGVYWCARCDKTFKGFSAFQGSTCKGKRGARHPRPERGQA